MKWDNAAHEGLLVAICSVTTIGGSDMKEIVAVMNDMKMAVTERAIS